MPHPIRVDRDAVAALLHAGHSAAEVAERVGCTRRTVERIRRDELGLPSQRIQRPFSWDELAAVELALADGASIAEALRSIGRGERAWSRRFKGRGWTQAQRSEFMVARRQARRAGIEL